MTPADILRAAAKRISQPGAWTQGAMWRDRHSGWTHEASCWCAYGAMAIEDKSHGTAIARKARSAFEQMYGSLFRFNDTAGSAEEVAAKLLEAAARLDGGQ